MSICARVEPPRGVDGSRALGKRKEPECSSPSSPPPSFLGVAPAKSGLRKPALPASRLGRPPIPPPPKRGSGGKLLAGYLAHEFLRFGTLLGERPAASASAAAAPSQKDPALAPETEPEPGRRYAEASWLLMAGGARVTGVVNPTQLGRWLRIKQ